MRALGVAIVLLSLTACSDKTTPVAPSEPAADTGSPAPAPPPRNDAPTGGRVFFVEPRAGATVTSPVHIEFGVENVTIVPAGQHAPDSGHHHLIVDAGLPDATLPIPANDHYIHFGDGSTSTDLTLDPGEHTLTLLLGDYLHIPHKPPVYSETITITVTE